MFDLIFYVPLTIFKIYRDASSWVEPVYTKLGLVCFAQGHNTVCDALTFLNDLAPSCIEKLQGFYLVADLFLFCYERDSMMSLSGDKQADIFDAFNSASRYLDNTFVFQT